MEGVRVEGVCKCGSEWLDGYAGKGGRTGKGD